MSIKEAYNEWAIQYDSNVNKTRDLEAKALRSCLAGIPFQSCLEIGCGTGKNTIWLVEKAKRITSVDLSPGMLALARQKVNSKAVEFVEADIRNEWEFRDSSYDLVSFSLVLEHVKDLQHVFRQASRVLLPGGHVYLGELHPFKQYLGAKARYEINGATKVVECHNHHVSEYVNIAGNNNLSLTGIHEFFDEEGDPIPRILACIFRKIEI